MCVCANLLLAFVRGSTLARPLAPQESLGVGDGRREAGEEPRDEARETRSPTLPL